MIFHFFVVVFLLVADGSVTLLGFFALAVASFFGSASFLVVPSAKKTSVSDAFLVAVPCDDNLPNTPPVLV